MDQLWGSLHSDLKTDQPVKDILCTHSHVCKYKEDLNCIIAGFNYQLGFYLKVDDPDLYALKQQISNFPEPLDIATEYEKGDIR